MEEIRQVEGRVTSIPGGRKAREESDIIQFK